MAGPQVRRQKAARRAVVGRCGKGGVGDVLHAKKLGTTEIWEVGEGGSEAVNGEGRTVQPPL